MPIARARSFGSGKVWTTIDIATGVSIEPPSACTMRAAISQPMSDETLHSSEPNVNSAMPIWNRSEEHTSELQSLMRNSYADFCLNKNNITHTISPLDLLNIPKSHIHHSISTR